MSHILLATGQRTEDGLIMLGSIVGVTIFVLLVMGITDALKNRGER